MDRNIPEAIIDILKSRGIGEENFDEFFSAAPKLAYDPFLLANMQAGVDLLLDAVDSGKKIVIYGDYDVDGITSTALMMKVLGSLTENLDYYIPSRLDEGYGLHKESIDRIHEAGGQLIVTVDCGSVSREETEYAHSLGIETLVTDHHNISEVRAEGIIINPWLSEDKYPFKGLAGVGVAYKVALAVARKREVPKQVMTEILELVTVGTIADIMPLLDENRTIVKCGLRFIHLGGKNKGLRRLIDLSGLDYRTLRAGDISYGIAPKINAAGRLGDATLGVKLLLAENEEDIEKYCNILIEANRERKALTDKAYEKGLELAPGELENGDFLMLEINDSHEGVLGIVAGKVRESVNRPVVVISRNGETYKGTGRSIPNVDLFEMLDKYRDEFVSFGGHKAACGFTIAADNVQRLKDNLNSDIADMLAEDETLFDFDYHYDAAIDPDAVDMQLAEVIEFLEPCGKGNEIPTFLLKDVNVDGWRFLKNDKYAKFNIRTEGDRRIECMLFHDADKYYEMADSGRPVDILGSIEINRWRDSCRLQIIVDWMLQEADR
ncbi:MAG: single-stranded-DNA-specific exonuclease RecJ [Clostridiales bacterium]|nr:single-stranded-DNA-specific exonuclease RecJ [Candidatus Crickella caballi]